jgi:large-conductance mechanosensitive channel
MINFSNNIGIVWTLVSVIIGFSMSFYQTDIFNSQKECKEKIRVWQMLSYELQKNEELMKNQIKTLSPEVDKKIKIGEKLNLKILMPLPVVCWQRFLFEAPIQFIEDGSLFDHLYKIYIAIQTLNSTIEGCNIFISTYQGASLLESQGIPTFDKRVQNYYKAIINPYSNMINTIEQKRINIKIQQKIKMATESLNKVEQQIKFWQIIDYIFSILIVIFIIFVIIRRVYYTLNNILRAKTNEVRSEQRKPRISRKQNKQK